MSSRDWKYLEMGLASSADRRDARARSATTYQISGTNKGRTTEHNRRAGTPKAVPTGSKLLKHIQLLATLSPDLGDIAGQRPTVASDCRQSLAQIRGHLAAATKLSVAFRRCGCVRESKRHTLGR